MACEYFVNGKWVSETQFKNILIGNGKTPGLIDNLINSGKLTIDNLNPIVNTNTVTKDFVPAKKMVEILSDEIKSRSGYPLNMLSALELDESGNNFKIPLWASPYADKFESLLTSVITNKVIKQKFNGHSYVLGSEEGFMLKEGDDAIKELFKSGIVFSPNYDAKKGLLPIRYDKATGKLLPAQIMVPFNFKDKAGSKLNLKDFMKIDENGIKVLDMEKIPDKILKLFGFRIPTQGHNSMASIEIVGFLPESSGDLILAPRDFTVQMGSDFDVDKLYSYMYNVQLKDGKLTTEFDDETGFVENRQNTILDIHHSIMENPNEDLVRAILAPDSFGEYEDLAAKVYQLRKDSGKIPEFNTILSDTYQRTKYINATMGKSGVGNFSLDSTFNAIIQNKDLHFEEVDKNGRNTFSIKFGSNESNGDLSNMYTIQSQRLLKKGNLTEDEEKSLKLKSKVIQGLQSSSVDNEKAQILDKLNINNQTFDAIRAMAQLGFEENEIIGLITQDIIWEYVNAVRENSSSLSKFNPNLIEDFKKKIKNKYDPNNKFDKLSDEEVVDYESLSGNQLLENLKTKQLVDVKDGIVPDSNIIQIALFNKFMKLSDLGKDIKSVQSAINIESSGLPKNLIETSVKVSQINNLNNSNIVNAHTLLGEYNAKGLTAPATINGFASYYGAIFADKIYAQYFPYSKEGFNKQFAELIDHVSDEELSQSKLSKLKTLMSKEFRSYSFATNNMNKYDSNIIFNEQKRLFTDSANNKSLASIVKMLSNKNWFKKNQFLNKLTTDINLNGSISRVNFEATTGENYDERDIYIGFLQLLNNDNVIGTFNGVEYTVSKLGQDLILHSILEGGNQGSKQFLKYIPVEYLKNSGFGDHLSTIDFNYSEDFKGGEDVNYKYPSGFTTQFFQNNPDKAYQLKTGEFVSPKVIKDSNSIVLTPEGIANNKIIKTDKEGNEFTTMRKFISLQDRSLPNKYALYKYNDSTKSYLRIPVLSGDYGFKQYNFDDSVNKSIQTGANFNVETEQVINPELTIVNSKEEKPVDYDPKVATVVNPIQQIDIELGKQGIQPLLKDVENSSANPYLKEIAKRLGKATVPANFRIEIINDVDGPVGSFNVDYNVMKLNKAKLDNSSNDSLAGAVIHEYVHALTSKVIKSYKKGEPITAEQKAICERLDNLRIQYENLLDKTEYENFKSKLSNKDFGDIDELTHQELLSKFYGATKLEEFVTMAMTDYNFQQILNDIKNKEGKSMFGKLKQLIIDLLKSIGIDVKSGSILEAALIDTFNLINSKEVQTVVETSIPVVKSKFEFPKDMTFNPEDFLISLQEDTEEFNKICK